MKKLICILASAALLAACEEKSEKTVVAPGTSPAPEKKVENNTTVVNPTEKTKETKETTNTNTTTATTPSTSSSTSTTTTTTSPHP